MHNEDFRQCGGADNTGQSHHNKVKSDNFAAVECPEAHDYRLATATFAKLRRCNFYSRQNKNETAGMISDTSKWLSENARFCELRCTKDFETSMCVSIVSKQRVDTTQRCSFGRYQNIQVNKRCPASKYVCACVVASFSTAVHVPVPMATQLTVGKSLFLKQNFEAKKPFKKVCMFRMKLWNAIKIYRISYSGKLTPRTTNMWGFTQKRSSSKNQTVA